MSATLWAAEPDVGSAADAALKLAVRAWFLVAVAGQWIFVGQRLALGLGNAGLAIHLMVAVVIMVGGPLQLIPQVRRHAPSFHRLNGRVYALAIFASSITGLYLVWARERAAVAYVVTSLHAVLIMGFTVLAVRAAIRRDMSSHRRWALRLFMMVNAGWFFRVGVLQWMFPGPAGAFLNPASLADYVLPLAMLELYLRMEDAGGKLAMAAGVLVLTVVLAARVAAWV